MIPSFSLSCRTARSLAATGTLLGLFATAADLRAGPVPANLGNGLGKLVESNLAVKASEKSGVRLEKAVTVEGRTYLDEQAAKYAANVISDRQGRVLVRVNPTAGTDFRRLGRALAVTANSLTVTASDPTYQGVGVFNAYVSLDDVPALATSPGVRSVILEVKPTPGAA